MNIGYLSDGDAEIRALPVLLRKTSSPHTIVGPIKTALQIDTRVDNIASAAKKGMSQLKALGAEAVIVVLDQETVSDCAPLLAQRIGVVLHAAYGAEFTSIEVVIKERTFENWLIADTAALDSQPARYALPEGVRKRINGGQSDHIDALTAIKKAAIKHDYAKIADAEKIARHADPFRIANASRSFRRLMRVHGDPAYAGQSRVSMSGPAT